MLDMGFSVLPMLFLGNPKQTEQLPPCPEICPSHHLKTPFWAKAHVLGTLGPSEDPASSDSYSGPYPSSC